MITRNFEITIRIPEQNYIPTLFQVVENDNDVYNLTIHITDGINEIDYSQVSSATITFALANGTVVQSDPERLAISSGGITYEMGTTEISCPGKVLASIQLFGEDGERLTTARFQFEVVADLITPGAVQSESHFPLLQQLVADVEQLKQDIVDLQIPDNSIMDVKLSDAAGQIKQRFATHMADSASHGGIQHKNLLHNWDFSIWQRGTSFPSNESGNEVFTADRWKCSWYKGIERIPNTSPHKSLYAIKITTMNVMNNGNWITQSFEHLSNLKDATLTLSAYVKASVACGIILAIKPLDGSESLITRNVNAGEWQLVTQTITLGSSGIAWVRIGTGAIAADETIEIGAVKLELGDTSTLANDPPANYSEQLAFCGPVVDTTAPTNYIGQDGQWQVY